MVRKIPKDKLSFGRELRKNPTIWEDKLWRHLKDKNLGVRFKRQVYIGGYLVDLCCNMQKLTIEIDGAGHRGNVEDQVRSEFLKREGYRVLRFWDSEIDKDINKVLEKIIKELRLTPPPTPPLVRGGEI
jgi:very-short-patch-repair endonuclease